MYTFNKYIFFVIILIKLETVQAQIQYSDSNRVKEFKLLTDTSGTLLPSEIESDEYQRLFYPITLPYRLDNTYVHFLKIKIDSNHLTPGVPYYLVLDNKYIKGLNRGIHKYTRHIAAPSEYSYYNLNELSQKALSGDYYLKLDNRNALLKHPSQNLNLKILSGQEFNDFRQVLFFKYFYKNIFKTSFLAVVLFLLWFTFFQWLINRQIVFIYYSFYLLAIFLFYLLRNGYLLGIQYNALGWIKEPLVRLVALGILLGYMLFITSFLNISKITHPTIVLLMKIGISIYFLGTLQYFILSAIGQENRGAIIFYITKDYLLLPIGVVFFYNILKIKAPLTKFIISGTLILLIMIFLTILNERINQFTGKNIELGAGSYSQFGILLELLIFSTGLGYRTRLIQQEKNTTQQALIQQLEQNQSLQTELNLKLQIEKEKLDIENQLTLVELRLLKAQINPHFLFNSFNALKDLIHQNKNGEAIQYLGKFTRMMRGILSSSEIQQHSLKDELAFCENYVALESVRFAKDLNLSVQASEESMTTMVPTMILQPILENAIWHGLLPSKDDRNITINSKIINQKLNIHILDNGVGLKSSGIVSIKENGYTSFGLRLVIDRLKYFAKDSTLAISDRLDTDLKSIGTIVAIEIPINNYSPSKTSNS